MNVDRLRFLTYRAIIFLKFAAQGIWKAVPIDRSTPFDPASFIGPGWSIAEQDARSSLDLHAVDLRKVSFMGQQQSGTIRLDAKVLQTLLENQHLIPRSWKEKQYGRRNNHIFFDGTILCCPKGGRYVLYLCWFDLVEDLARWQCGLHWLGDIEYRLPSAVLVV